MAYHQYKCKKCEHEFELSIGLVDGKYILYVPFTEEEEEELWAQGKDPRFEETELPLKELPESPPCTNCDSEETEKLMSEFNGWCKGNCFTNRERERKFYEKGMDKQRANEFYKQSMEASQQRMMTGKEHYKQVVPDMKHMMDKGVAKRTPDDKVAAKRDYIKRVNVKLGEISGKLPKETIK
jgi:hypothetical protein